MSAENFLAQWISCEQPEFMVVAVNCPFLPLPPATTTERELASDIVSGPIMHPV